MKPFELTEKDKGMLLTMARYYYPELKDLEIRDSMEDFGYKDENVFIEFGRSSNKVVCIHWLEFIEVYIVSKIDKRDTLLKSDIIENLFNYFLDYKYDIKSYR